MLTDQVEQKYNVVVNGETKRHSVSKRIAESYILQLNERDQENADIVPVTSDGKQVLLG